MTKTRDIESSAFSARKLQVPRAEAAGVNIFCIEINLNATLKDPAFADLSDEEQDHASCYHRKIDALLFASARASLRTLLSRKFNVHPHSLKFEKEHYGRPHLAWAAPIDVHNPIDFNISHSGHYALIAIAEGRRVGIDIELRSEDQNWNSLSSVFLASRDLEYIMSLPVQMRNHAYYNIWVAKEAFLKAIGTGLSTDMKSFSVLNKDKTTLVAVPEANDRSGVAQLNYITEFDAEWCPAPLGYSACIVWSRTKTI